MENYINLSIKIIRDFNKNNELYVFLPLIAFFVFFIYFGYNSLYRNEAKHYPFRRRNALSKKEIEEILRNL
jgi:hypothetical protein